MTNTTVQHRRGTTAQHSSFVGAPGEITVDTDLHAIRVHDGTTPGGWPASMTNSGPNWTFTGAAPKIYVGVHDTVDFTTGGNVTINAPSSGTPLSVASDVGGSLSISASAGIQGVTGTGNFALRAVANAGNTLCQVQLTNNAANAQWGVINHNGAMLSVVNTISGTNYGMTISSAGNVSFIAPASGNTLGLVGAGSATQLLDMNATAGAGTMNQIVFRSNGTAVGTITNSTTTTSYNTSSDYRLKHNSRPLTDSGEFIDALAPKVWDWHDGSGIGVGFIAHEVQAVSPSSVTGEKDAVDEDGNPIMQTMEYGSPEFIANIVAELQSLRARVKALEAR